MSSPLRHSRPDPHDAGDFAETIRVVPSSLDEYAEQLAYLRELRARRGDRKFDSLLIVGAGDGRFAQVALQLLAATELIQSDLSVDVVENEDALWRACASRLIAAQERGAVTRQRVAFSIPNLAETAANNVRHWGYLRRKELSYFQLPSLEGPLRMAVEQLGSNYDLIIASHLTYYFPDAGATLAYFLASRCLKSDGIAWFVVRDRDCGFFKLRAKLLHEASLPDVNYDRFSDSFLDGVCCLSDSGIGIRVNRRRTNLWLESRERASQEKVIKFLMGLESLPRDILSRIGTNERGFSESHVWIEGAPHVLRESRNERAALIAVDTITRCVGIVRMVCQDAQVLRVSLESYTPRDDSETALGADELLNVNRPLPFPRFQVQEHGFVWQHTEAGFEEQVLNEYCRLHNSFIFYRRFFLDYYHGSKSYACLRRLGSLTRELERREVYTGISARPEARAKSADDNFAVALEDWHELLERYYCTNNSSLKSNVWTISIGSRLLRTQARDLPLQHEVNFCGGFFLTWATSRTFDENDAAKFVGQIKTRLSQYLALELFARFRQKTIELKKYQSAMEILIQTMRGLTKAADDMQRNTEQLRALMFDPAESLFDCYARIAPFFSEGTAVRVSDWIPAVRIKDTHAAYEEAERKVVFAAVFCAIFGRQEELGRVKTVRAIFAKFSKILTDIESSPAYEELFRRLQFVIGGREQLDLAHPDDWQPEALNRALRRIKRCLFTPFKFETLEWPSIALQLASKEPYIAGADLQGELREDQNLTIPPWTPVRYSAVIAFILQFCRAWRGTKTKSDRITTLSHEHAAKRDQEQVVFSIEFSTKFVFGDSSRPEKERINYCRDILRKVATSPRDWRIEGTDFGDLTRPFVVIVNRITGLYTQPDPEWEMSSNFCPDELFKIASGKNEFLIDVQWRRTHSARLRIVWRTADTKKS